VSLRESYTVRVSKDYLVFCSGHFISYEGHQCERLHGHNYRAAVELEGDLDENWYVFDFIALKRIARGIIADLDHRMLLPTRNPLIRVTESGGEVHVAYRERRWMFPKDDCCLLPIENTTAELLARHIGGRVRAELEKAGAKGLRVMRVEVEEAPGQFAVYEARPA
jgi:6-pyruvoyltetrahydropterin/6-carboxytetrahydropterin synthase